MYLPANNIDRRGAEIKMKCKQTDLNPPASAFRPDSHTIKPSRLQNRKF